MHVVFAHMLLGLIVSVSQPDQFGPMVEMVFDKDRTHSILNKYVQIIFETDFTKWAMSTA